MDEPPRTVTFVGVGVRNDDDDDDDDIPHLVSRGGSTSPAGRGTDEEFLASGFASGLSLSSGEGSVTTTTHSSSQPIAPSQTSPSTLRSRRFSLGSMGTGIGSPRAASGERGLVRDRSLSRLSSSARSTGSSALDDFERRTAELAASIRKERSAVEADRRAALEDERPSSSGGGGGGSSWNASGSERRVRLNVGGDMYVTSIATLTKDSYSMLGAMFSGRWEMGGGGSVDGMGGGGDPETTSTKSGKSGRSARSGATTPRGDLAFGQSTGGALEVFLDRDGTWFRYVLNYLRDGSLALPDGFDAWAELAAELNYYGLMGALEQLEGLQRRSRRREVRMSVLPSLLSMSGSGRGNGDGIGGADYAAAVESAVLAALGKPSSSRRQRGGSGKRTKPAQKQYMGIHSHSSSMSSVNSMVSSGYQLEFVVPGTDGRTAYIMSKATKRSSSEKVSGSWLEELWSSDDEEDEEDEEEDEEGDPQDNDAGDEAEVAVADAS